MIYCCEHFPWLEEQEYHYYYEMLSKQRQQKLDRYYYFSDKEQGLTAYLLLQYGMMQEIGIFSKPIFTYSKNNKPYITELPNMYFNLSHCKYGAVCAIDRVEIGTDIQEITKYDENEAKLVMNKKEIGIIEKNINRNEAFTRLWTLKESYVKMLGLGIAMDLEQIDFSNMNYNQFKQYGYQFEVHQLGNMFLSICSKKCHNIKKVDKMDFFNLLENYRCAIM
jgi:4'-phosphopantetheinyl transferase